MYNIFMAVGGSEMERVAALHVGCVDVAIAFAFKQLHQLRLEASLADRVDRLFAFRFSLSEHAHRWAVRMLSMKLGGVRSR